MPVDRLAALYPDHVDDMSVCWNGMRIPGPPLPFRLTPEEGSAVKLANRFRRRTIMAFDVGSSNSAGRGPVDRLAFIDKAVPHCLYDFMCAELSAPAKATVEAIDRQTATVVWHSACNFVAFVSRPEIRRAYGLSDGRLHLALNCDPNTLDRESIQASKQFHLHFLYWTRRELAGLRRDTQAGGAVRELLRRRWLDPLSFAAPAVVSERLQALGLKGEGMTLMPFDPADAAHRGKPMGCLIRLSDWSVLKHPEFAVNIIRVHRCIAESSAQLQAAFTGSAEPPAPWQRHSLLPLPAIRANVARLGFSRQTTELLCHLAGALRNLSPQTIAFLKKHGAARRRHLSLNNPCYALNLYAPEQNNDVRPLIAAREIYLIVQVRLFSAIGGAGLLCLDDVPCVRIVREQGRFSEDSWRRRARFQRDFAQFNYSRIEQIDGLFPPLRYRFVDCEAGWCQDGSN